MKTLRNLNLADLLFLDIETTTLVKELQVGTPLFDSWSYKMRKETPDCTTEYMLEEFKKRGSLYSEFSKIVCISVGKIKEGVLKIKSFCNHDEYVLLDEFCKTINNVVASNKKTILAGHAIKGFDVPYIMRRCLVNQIQPPDIIDIGGLKPWDVNMVDTLELWKGTGFNSASLINIAVALNIQSPKDEIEGCEVYDTYYNHEDPLPIIQRYCEKDVLTAANIILRCRFEEPIQAQHAEVKEKGVGVLIKTFNTKQLTNEDGIKINNKVKKLTLQEQVIAKEIIDICVN